MSVPDSVTPLPSPDNIGTISSKIPVELSTRFLEHFSEQLYSSPQKAFEELISNGWDAGANFVDVRVSTDLQVPEATMSVLDNGASMDVAGLNELWHIAFSSKPSRPHQYGRPMIGKFGIGKLATYVLAGKLTYICKAHDGVIRRVTMDYSDIDRRAGSDGDRAEEKLIRDLELDLYEVNEEEVQKALASIYGGQAVLDLIERGFPNEENLVENEFGGAITQLRDAPNGTWTLVVLSDLKPAGRDLKLGVLRRMLQAALPLGSEMAIVLNGQKLDSSKLDLPTIRSWVIGPELGVNFVEVSDSDLGPLEPDEESSSSEDDPDSKLGVGMTRVEVISRSEPYPHVEIEGIGRITGLVRLFEDRISGGKSDERGASNGFQVNVLGRVINQNEPTFGERNLSHAAWARFRMAVRADGLNEFLLTDRERVKSRRELRLFRAFLRRAFNKARTVYDDDEQVRLPDGGDILVRSLGVISLKPLRTVVSEILQGESPIPDLFDEGGIGDREERRRSWRENTADNIGNALGDVRYEKLHDDSFVKFRIADNSILVNTEHPFVAEYANTKAKKELVRTIAMINLLSDVYALDIGVIRISVDYLRFPRRSRGHQW